MKNNTDTSKYALVCGMEVHAELKTASKMFCGCKNDPFGAEQPNSHTCPVCLGMPGGIPVTNKKAIEWTIKLGLALGCKINLFSKFDRKHYFYPDLAKSYQISQYDMPFCYDGVVETSEGPIRIRRIHLEEDTGKLLHKTIPGENGPEKVSLVDFNRSGVPLVEIVTEADIKTATQAKEYGKKLRQIMRYLEIADCDMEQGGMRLEANLSLRTIDSPDPVGVEQNETNLPAYKVELKNINSFRFMEQAIAFEMDRQATQLDAGETPVQETRGWDSNKNITFSQRTKEDAEDYRYFPDPDIPPIRFTNEQIEAWRSELPELAETVVKRWQTEHGIEPKYSELLTEDPQTTQHFEAVLTQATTNKESNKVDLNLLANMLVNKKIDARLIDKPNQLLKAFTEATATDSIDDSELLPVIESVLSANPDAVEKYKAGKTQVIGFLVGQTMSKLAKKVDAQIVRSKIAESLE